ncbi:Ribosomal protein S6 [Dillenia turbinata]|uniref:Ribosomal protein S6 n=1 Tax=Dillenia turbinata TaxID=194707 RepID=A0AAN8UJ28_9MAGN
MEAFARTSSFATIFTLTMPPSWVDSKRVSSNYIACLVSTDASFYSCQISSRRGRKSVIVEAKKKNKVDSHSFVAKPDEATGPFPEALLLKEKKVEKDGKLLPEFADAEEEELFEFLNLQLESDQCLERVRHYEVVYLIHEKHFEEVESVNTKVQDFLREKKGKVWRFNDWGMRRLAYKIQKAKNANYILMNFELEARWINDFKSMLDQDERVIRHLVIKRDKAITDDCPPPPEFHTLRADMDDIDDDYEDDMEYDEDDGEYREDEGEMDSSNDSDNNRGNIIYVTDDDIIDNRNKKSDSVKNIGRKNARSEKVARIVVSGAR